MIDINKTIYTNILDKLNYLRYQAVDNPKAFKALMSLVILDYMIYWADELGEPQCVIQKLIDKRHNILIHNSCINPVYADIATAYVNVNTPQSNDDWKRVWDIETEDCITLSPNCPVDKFDPNILRWGGIKNL